jgi:hypothetical protein
MIRELVVFERPAPLAQPPKLKANRLRALWAHHLSGLTNNSDDWDSGPNPPILRANPYPEVTDLICRLPLSTLFYQLEAVNLGDLMRLWVRSGRGLSIPLDFQGMSNALQTRRRHRACSNHRTRSRVNLINPGPWTVMKRRDLSLGHLPSSPTSVASPLP